MARNLPMGLLLRWAGFLLLFTTTSALFASDIGHMTEVENTVELIRSGAVCTLTEGVAVSADVIVRTSEVGISQVDQ